MLKAKLYLDANTLDGGFESFILDNNSYIILNKDSNYDISMYKIIYEYNNYILIYNEWEKCFCIFFNIYIQNNIKIKFNSKIIAFYKIKF